MTGIETLRAIARASLDNDTFCEVWEIVRLCPDDILNCKACKAEFFDCLADKIERETLPRPLFEDGEPVQQGDEYVGKKTRNTHKAEAIMFTRRGFNLCANDYTEYERGERVKRPKQHDTQKRTCKWVSRGIGLDTYETECGRVFTWEPEGTPDYCPGCGGKVVQE